MVVWPGLLLLVLPCLQCTSLFGPCDNSSQCGAGQECERERQECRCRAGLHVWHSRCIPALAWGDPCREEVSTATPAPQHQLCCPDLLPAGGPAPALLPRHHRLGLPLPPPQATQHKNLVCRVLTLLPAAAGT